MGGLTKILMITICFSAIGCSTKPNYESRSSFEIDSNKYVKESKFYCEQTTSDYAETKEYRNGNFICLTGPIDRDFYLRYMELSPKPTDIVVVRSGGGEIGSAMDVGDQLWRMGNLVIVDNICGSACAYFIALGSRRLAFTRAGVLGFHGGPMSAEAILADDNLDTAAKSIALAGSERFQDFFAKRGVDISITTDVPESLKNDIVDWHKVMWIRTAEELKRYGFHNVLYCDSSYCL